MVTAELINKLVGAFEMALQKAAQSRANGENPQKTREVLAIAREIIEAVCVLRRIHGPREADGGVATMQVNLEAIGKLLVATDDARPPTPTQSCVPPVRS